MNKRKPLFLSVLSYITTIRTKTARGRTIMGSKGMSLKVGLAQTLNYRMTKAVRKWDTKNFIGTRADGQQNLNYAPKSIREKKIITQEDIERYNAENAVYDAICNNYMKTLIDKLYKWRKTGLSGYTFTVWGVGIGRDLEWIHYANELSLIGQISEWSPVAYQNGENLLAKLNVTASNYLYREKISGQESISEQSWFGYAGGFIQVQPPHRARPMMRRIGEFLKLSGRTFTLAHAAPEDNTGVEWGDTHNYPWSQLLQWAAQGFGGPVKTFCDGAEIKHWDQIYRVKTLVPA